MRSTLCLGVVVACILVTFTDSLQCYEGTKGELDNGDTGNFVKTNCDAGMEHCFSSFNDDGSDVTASCQTPATSDSLLDVCQVGCVNHTNIGVTICCCGTDLCNVPPGGLPPNPSVEKDEPKSGPILRSRRNV